MRYVWLTLPRHRATWCQSVFTLLHTHELSEGLDVARGASIRLDVWRRFPKSPTFLLFPIIQCHPSAHKISRIKRASRQKRVVKQTRPMRIIIQIPKIHTHAVVEDVF